jgi:hypothetical protein
MPGLLIVVLLVALAAFVAAAFLTGSKELRLLAVGLAAWVAVDLLVRVDILV